MDPFAAGSLPVAALAAGVVFFGYFVFGISGFGASLLTIPVLSHFLPLTQVLAITAVIDLVSSVTLGVSLRRDADRSELTWMLPFALAGAVLGTWLLLTLPARITLAMLGAFLLGFGLWSLATGAPRRMISGRWAPVAGLAGGTIGTLFGTGGPPYAIYLTRRLHDKARMRATLTTMVALNLVLRFGVFVVAGVMAQPGIVSWLVLLFPPALVAMWLGHRTQVGMSRESLLRCIYLVLIASGLSLVARSLLA